MRRDSCVLCLLMCLACGGGSDGYKEPETPTGPSTPTSPTTPTTPTAPTEVQVSVQDNSYSPATVNITTGKTVTWTWASGNYAQHSVTFDDGTNSSAAQTTGTHQRSFPTAGTYTYYCTVHGSGMSGSVVVSAP